MADNIVLNQFFTCPCQSDEHIFSLKIYDWNIGNKSIEDNITDNVELMISIHLSQHNGFWKRLIHAFKYVFGYKCKFGDFDCSDIVYEDISKLRDILNKFEEVRNNYIEKSMTLKENDESENVVECDKEDTIQIEEW